ncbi:MAG: hydroxyethylthiazole kinase [Methanocalculus sp. MSAO_Arc1]|uniref:hydroxyethylthiazole kinase n=1 Tax=Methanocalculus TaxID=71151 RepID=UPI000FF5AA02|nr:MULTISPECIES: hydroxyethylthiazole kinase [unclassified Methanocalculus]MCP1662711.1 hydroxyethylthiazole kinase [Methanocalculus sp. AMF5]RQD79977.1 MAG: hydroxyethylthiazole kinase [Methanocalculus sp. MSAO_Arc1]
MNDSAAALFGAIRENRPLVHHITNTVTINDCANATLAIGAAPVMAGAIGEVAEMVAIADALVLNIGTITPDQVDAMVAAAHAANRKGIPVILDPVGVGATTLRTASAERILNECTVTILKGNAGEVGVLAGTGGTVRGVDSGGCRGDPVDVALASAERWDTTVAMTGPTDVISGRGGGYLIKNGHPMMERLSGTGCMAASIVGAFAAGGDDPVLAAASALAAFGIAGELGAAGARGPYTFRTTLFDELSMLSPDDLVKKAAMERIRGI